jgi:peptide/nickel transport system permease protein
MLAIILRRLVIAIPTIILVSLIVFTLQKLLPGDPVLTLAGDERDPQVLAFLRAKYHLDDPIYVQYLAWIRQILSGDFGVSLRTDTPVLTLIAQKLPVTLELGSLAMLFVIVIGVPMGIVSAVKQGTWIDYLANAVALSGLSIPNFWFGILLILLISVQWHLLPASGYVSPFQDPLGNLKTIVMPAFVLGNALAASLMRHTRSAMLGVLQSDYIRTARAKGLLAPAVVLKHALRNALIPIITVTTLLLGELLGGAVLTEQIFTIPGFGKLVVDAVFNRDYAVVQGVVLCTAIGFIALNLVADVLYILANPRLRVAA